MPFSFLSLLQKYQAYKFFILKSDNLKDLYTPKELQILKIFLSQDFKLIYDDVLENELENNVSRETQKNISKYNYWKTIFYEIKILFEKQRKT